MNLSSTDSALADGFAGPEPFVPANDAANTRYRFKFHLTIRQYDGTLISQPGWFVDSIAAMEHGLVLGGLGSRITVRPDVETTFLHGRARFPHSLHPMATLEALDGWVTAANKQKDDQARAVNFRAALRLQQEADVRNEWRANP